MAAPRKKHLCPWQNRPTHNRNRMIEVDGYRPIVTGYCGEDESCTSCAGTTYKPNIDLRHPRPYEFVPCPYCSPEDYRKRVERLKARLPQ